jgi:hypothetical protein
MAVITTPESLSTDCRVALSDLLRLPVEQVMAAWNVSQTDRGYDWNLYGSRVVHVPQPLLGDVQRQILDRFLRTGPISPAAYSGVPGRSYVMAAMKHLGGPAAETAALDFADAFGSATYRHARAALSKRLSHELWILGLTGSESTAVVQVLSHLVTVDDDSRTRRLPLGSPSSVAMFNLILLPLDGEILRWCGEHGITYTRYVDDMVFSCPAGLPADLESRVESVVVRHRFRLNQRKTIRYPAGSATVHGLEQTAEGVVPGAVARDRFTARALRHQRIAADRTASQSQRERSRGILRGLDVFLRQFYETQNRERPASLRILVPAGASRSAPPIDLLWE